MTTRKATIEDIGIIRQLFWELDTDAILHQPEHFLRAERPEDYLVSVIEGEKTDLILSIDDGKVIGFSLLLERETGNISCLKKCRYAYIQDFIITAAYRNQGHGTSLFLASKAWATERELEYLRLSVFPTNEAGIRFYRRLGLLDQMITMECRLSP